MSHINMEEIILLKQGEMVLKGLNKHKFEQILLNNIRYRLRDLGRFEIVSRQSVVYIKALDPNTNIDDAFQRLKNVFGVISLNKAVYCDKNKETIAETAIEYLKDDMKEAKSFKVESKRGDKTFPLTSIELSQYVGDILSDNYPNVKVDMHTPDFIVNIEVRENAAYIHGMPVKGAGGMPLGSNGKAVTLLSGGIDSPVSTYLIAKRGVKLIPIHFFSYPYTSNLAKQKVIEIGHILTEYCGSMTLEVVPFTRIQEQIKANCPFRYYTLVMRRFMMRIAERIASDNDCKAIVTGENLGQVASQTMEAMASSQDVLKLPVLQPLVGLDKEEIVHLSRKIGTYEKSIEPYEDCCTVFTPKHPETHPMIEDVRNAESLLDTARLVDEAVTGIETIRL